MKEFAKIYKNSYHILLYLTVGHRYADRGLSWNGTIRVECIYKFWIVYSTTNISHVLCDILSSNDKRRTFLSSAFTSASMLNLWRTTWYFLFGQHISAQGLYCGVFDKELIKKLTHSVIQLEFPSCFFSHIWSIVTWGPSCWCSIHSIGK